MVPKQWKLLEQQFEQKLVGPVGWTRLVLSRKFKLCSEFQSYKFPHKIMFLRWIPCTNVEKISFAFGHFGKILGNWKQKGTQVTVSSLNASSRLRSQVVEDWNVLSTPKGGAWGELVSEVPFLSERNAEKGVVAPLCLLSVVAVLAGFSMFRHMSSRCSKVTNEEMQSRSSG